MLTKEYFRHYILPEYEGKFIINIFNKHKFKQCKKCGKFLPLYKFYRFDGVICQECRRA